MNVLRLLFVWLLLTGFAPVQAHAPPHVIEAVFVIDDIIWMILIQILVASLNYLLAPKPAQQKPPAATPWTNPQASAGMPIPVVFGTLTQTGPNVLWFGDKSIQTDQVQM